MEGFQLKEEPGRCCIQMLLRRFTLQTLELQVSRLCRRRVAQGGPRQSTDAIVQQASVGVDIVVLLRHRFAVCIHIFAFFVQSYFQTCESTGTIVTKHHCIFVMIEITAAWQTKRICCPRTKALIVWLSAERGTRPPFVPTHPQLALTA